MDNTIDNNALKANKKRSFWFRILILGFVIYLASLIAFASTGNPNLFPTIALVGNFLVPVSFVAFFYERRNRFNVSLISTALSFIFGGVLGTAAAAILEPHFIHSLSFNSAFIVGVIEESTKMIGVLLIAKRGKHTSGLDGIILGAAAGMGFAALESTGYVFTYFLESGGNLSEAVALTLIRGAISPVGHGAWTAILASVIFSESGLYGYNITGKVIAAFLTVVALHGLWDGIPFILSNFMPCINSVLIGQLLVGAIGFIILVYRWRAARRQLRITNLI
jgi:RsiW-degrading membrane proteinase PrsW (M82 family)